MGIRVAHVGTGTTGKEALRAILQDPALDLVALWVTTPEKEGVDAGTLCGLPEVGIAGTRDLDAVLESELDCFSYGGTTVGRQVEACADIARFLERGIDVVTFALESLVYPPAAPPQLRELLESACSKGGSTFFASGMEPGWASLSLPYTLLSVAGELTSYREEQHALDMAEAYPIKEVVFGSMAFGKPQGTVPPRFVDGMCASPWIPNLHVVADALGAELETTRFLWETHPTPGPLETALGPVEAGSIGAYYWQLQGIVGGEPRIAVEYIARVTRGAPVPAHWPQPAPDTRNGGIVYEIEGRPSFRVQIYAGSEPGEGVNAPLAMTANHPINAIPSVIAAGPGLVTARELTPYTTRRARFGASGRHATE